MTSAILEDICGLLNEIGTPGSFTARRSRPVDDLLLEVRGLGALRLPVSSGDAERLVEIGRPARYGKGEATLLDRDVRDTWEIPKSRVKIDRRRWNRTLRPILEELRSDLGIPDDHRLKAEFHSMLVYGPGHFFLPHRDSEKGDGMVGTLVVMLPSSFKGGAMHVEHRGKRLTYRGSKKDLSFVAFYADCLHEVRPVRAGHRIVLTYNLLLDGDGASGQAPGDGPFSEKVDALADHLREYFETPLPPRYHWQKDDPTGDPPTRMIYFLDHQYTERGLGWSRLKGDDIGRVAALRAAAGQIGCEVALAGAEVHETWCCMGPDGEWERPRKYRSWRRGDSDEWLEDEPSPRDDPDAYQLEDLLDGETALTHWIDASEEVSTPVTTDVDPSESCATIPSSELEAHTSEYEGYMGNYGNTMDRWYRRAALVLWPQELTFTVRGEASPTWALSALERHLRSGAESEAREMAAALLPFWDEVAGRGDAADDLVDPALRVAEGLDDPELAAALLRPFALKDFTPKRAPTLVALWQRYGEVWSRSLLARWTDEKDYSRRTPVAWTAAMPRLARALRRADGESGARFATLLLVNRWQALRAEIASKVQTDSSSWRKEAVAALAKPILGVLWSAEGLEAVSLRDEAVSFLCSEENEALLPGLVKVLRSAVGKGASFADSQADLPPGLAVLGRHCVERLEARLAELARGEDDWSIELPDGCACELCDTLQTFLGDPDQRELHWPIKKQRRLHVHRRIDNHELPVQHTTQRSGSPHTLILSKTQDLFANEAKERRSWQADLDWLTRSFG